MPRALYITVFALLTQVLNCKYFLFCKTEAFLLEMEENNLYLEHCILIFRKKKKKILILEINSTDSLRNFLFLLCRCEIHFFFIIYFVSIKYTVKEKSHTSVPKYSFEIACLVRRTDNLILNLLRYLLFSRLLVLSILKET